MYNKYTFSGHESFPCKSLWLTKGYDFIINGGDFNASDAVVALGVGKNMVTSIRYWLKAFGLSEQDKPNAIANYLFNYQKGKDRYVESLGTLYILHYLLISTGIATLYHITFVHFQKERKSFDREQLLNFVMRMMIADHKDKLFNANTVRKDIGVLLQNYAQPFRPKSFEDYSSLLIDLDLIRTEDNGKTYIFNIDGKRKVPQEIFLYAVLRKKGTNKVVPFDTLQEIGLTFCMSDTEIMEMAYNIGTAYPNDVQFSDHAGIRQMLFNENSSLSPITVLKKYYNDAKV